MDDLISRQAAIEAVEKESQIDGAYGYMDTKSIVDLLSDLPSAERRGRWKDVEHAPNGLFYATCSVCGERQTIEVANYCPMCGARMEGKDNDE